MSHKVIMKSMYYIVVYLLSGNQQLYCEIQKKCKYAIAFCVCKYFSFCWRAFKVQAFHCSIPVKLPYGQPPKCTIFQSHKNILQVNKLFRTQRKESVIVPVKFNLSLRQPSTKILAITKICLRWIFFLKIAKFLRSTRWIVNTGGTETLDMPTCFISLVSDIHKHNREPVKRA